MTRLTFFISYGVGEIYRSSLYSWAYHDWRYRKLGLNGRRDCSPFFVVLSALIIRCVDVFYFFFSINALHVHSSFSLILSGYIAFRSLVAKTDLAGVQRGTARATIVNNLLGIFRAPPVQRILHIVH